MNHAISNKLTQELLNNIRKKVVNQSRYICNTTDYPKYESVWDDMYEAADSLTDQQTLDILGNDNPILSDDKLLQLLDEISITDLYKDDAYVDKMADYLLNNSQHLIVLWDVLYDKANIK